MSFQDQEVVECLKNTLNVDSHVRQVSENYLKSKLNDENFLEFLIGLINNENLTNSIKLSSVLFVKNSIDKYWIKRHLQMKKDVDNIQINETSKLNINKLIIEALLLNNDYNINVQLLSIVSLFLNSSINHHNKYGYELLTFVESLINNDRNSNEFKCCLNLVLELTKYYRWSVQGFNNNKSADSINDSIQLLNNLIKFVSPILLNNLQVISMNLNNNENNLFNENLDNEFCLLYLILKIFKYCVFSDLCEYFLVSNDLNIWIDLQLSVTKINFKNSINADPSVNRGMKNFRVKTQKWSCFNLIYIFNKYGGGNNGIFEINSFYQNIELHKDQLKAYKIKFQQTYLKLYFEMFLMNINNWYQKSFVIFEEALYHYIKFFNICLNNDEVYSTFLNDTITSLIEYLIFPSIILSDDELESFYSDDEEFYRNYYDSGMDNRKPSSAAVSFIYKLSRKHFNNVVNPLLQFITNNFTNHGSNKPLIEANLRLLGILAFQLAHDGTSPVVSQIDQLVETFLVPLLKMDNESFIVARCIETIGRFHHKYDNLQLLGTIFEFLMNLLNKDNDLIIMQILSFDCLRNLVMNEDIINALKAHIGNIIQKLLALVTDYEIEILPIILQDFISIFNEDLKPFASDLSEKLIQQFSIKINELLDINATISNTDDSASLTALLTNQSEKESQCLGIISNLNTIANNMKTGKEFQNEFLRNFDYCIKFVLTNSMIDLLDSVLDLVTLIMKNLKEVIPSLQNIFDFIVENFETYGFENYFDCFNNFFETYLIICYENNKNLASDFRLISLMKLVIKTINEIYEDLYADTNACFLIFENILLLLRINNENQFIMAEDNSSNENEMIQTILEISTTKYYNLIVSNLEEFALLTEEDADLCYFDSDLILICNNFVKLLLASFNYKPLLTISVINNLQCTKELIALVIQLDETNNESPDSHQLTMDLFWQLVNKIWLFNKNEASPFLKIQKLNNFGVKMDFISISNILDNLNSFNIDGTMVEKLYLKLLKDTKEIPTLDNHQEDEYNDDFTDFESFKENEELRLKILTGDKQLIDEKIQMIYNKPEIMNYVNANNCSGVIQEAFKYDMEHPIN